MIQEHDRKNVHKIEEKIRRYDMISNNKGLVNPNNKKKSRKIISEIPDFNRNWFIIG